MAAPNKENGMYSPEQLKILREIYPMEASDSEFQMFGMIAKKSGLDPFSRQIFPVKRRNQTLGRDVMTTQTGIEGYRSIAEKTGKYSPGRDTEYGYTDSGELLYAKAFVKKMTPDGTWHEFSYTAFYSEYVQLTKSGCANSFWKNKPRIMLAKCAEAAALRRGFPQELSGIYTKEEMEVDEEDGKPDAKPIEDEFLSSEKVFVLDQILKGKEDLKQEIFKIAQVNSFDKIQESRFQKLLEYVQKKIEKNEVLHVST